MLRDDILQRLRECRSAMAARFGVRRLVLFGSVARNEARADSDVDLLVRFEGRADFDRFMGLKLYLEDLLGRRVDLVTTAALRPEIHEALAHDAIDAG